MIEETLMMNATQLDYVEKLGVRRQDQQWAIGARHGNNGPNVYAWGLRNHRLGAGTEGAGKLYLGPSVVWHHFKRHGVDNNLPDLSDFIDVKGTLKRHHCLIVQANDRPDWAYWLILDQRPVFHLRGWCWGWEAQQERFKSDPAGGRPAYFVKPDDPVLRTPAELFYEVHEKRRVA